MIAHGDDIPSYNSIPWYGIQRKTRSLIALTRNSTPKLEYFVMGHFHTQTALSDLACETLINGAWVSTGPWGYESRALYTKPVQLLHGVHAEWGVTWRLPILLVSGKEEKPERYKLSLIEEKKT